MLVTQLCPILCNLKDCSPSSFYVHGILQARVLEWLAIPFSRVSSQATDWSLVSCRQILYHLSHQGSALPPPKKKKHMVNFWLLAFYTGVEFILTCCDWETCCHGEKANINEFNCVCSFTCVLTVSCAVGCYLHIFKHSKSSSSSQLLFHSLFSEAFKVPLFHFLLLS